MLQRVLQEIESAQAPITLNQLAYKLGLERSALEGMIKFWIRKGRIQEVEPETTAPSPTCSSCATTCPGPQGCPFIMKMPRAFTIVKRSSL